MIGRGPDRQRARGRGSDITSLPALKRYNPRGRIAIMPSPIHPEAAAEIVMTGCTCVLVRTMPAARPLGACAGDSCLHASFSAPHQNSIIR